MAEEEGYAAIRKRQVTYDMLLMRRHSILVETIADFVSDEEIAYEVTTFPYVVHLVRIDALYGQQKRRLLKRAKLGQGGETRLLKPPPDEDDAPPQRVFPIS
jgi:hypothetical protein